MEVQGEIMEVQKEDIFYAYSCSGFETFPHLKFGYLFLHPLIFYLHIHKNV